MATRSARVNMGRILETGTLLGILSLVLALTGVLLSPTVMSGTLGVNLAADLRNVLYVVHMASAILLVIFTIAHLVPFSYSFLEKAGTGLAQRLMSFALLGVVLVEVATGYQLYFHEYRFLDKAPTVYVHLVTTAGLVLLLAVHAWRGIGVWRSRRAARATALGAAEAKGKGDVAREAQRTVSRRAFLRVSAYATAGLALAYVIGAAANREIMMWRLNSVGRTPEITKDSWRLKVTGLVGKPIELTWDDLVSMRAVTKEFTHHCVEGWTYTNVWTGIPLAEVLQRAGGVKPGAQMIVFKSPERSQSYWASGQQYTTNFLVKPGAFDDVYLVYAVSGQDLPKEHGFPVRVMSPRKWGYKACKWVTEIELSPDAGYRGYWERAGYHNDGDYPGPIFA